MIGRRKCGTNALRFNDCKVGIRTHVFFHGSTTERKRKNLIKGMRDDNEVWQANEEVFSSLLNEYYAGLFSSSNPHDFERILDGVEEVVTEDIRRDLAQPYTTKEVDVAIKEMAPLKAPGPDGMPPLFYQTY